jgi:hypothetical protein
LEDTLLALDLGLGDDPEQEEKSNPTPTAIVVMILVDFTEIPLIFQYICHENEEALQRVHSRATHETECARQTTRRELFSISPPVETTNVCLRLNRPIPQYHKSSRTNNCARERRARPGSSSVNFP